MLEWGRTSAGLSVEEAARKVALSVDRLEAWESEDSQPTIKQLRKLANAYKRPLSVFYLPERPRDFQALRDFRRLPGQVAGRLSSAIRLGQPTNWCRMQISFSY